MSFSFIITTYLLKSTKVQSKYTRSIQKKHLTKRRKIIKKIIKARNMNIIGNSPMVKSLEEKHLSIHHHLLTVFKLPIISFLPNTPHKARPYHLLYCSTPASEKVSHSSRHDPSQYDTT